MVLSGCRLSACLAACNEAFVHTGKIGISFTVALIWVLWRHSKKCTFPLLWQLESSSTKTSTPMGPADVETMGSSSRGFSHPVAWLIWNMVGLSVDKMVPFLTFCDSKGGKKHWRRQYCYDDAIFQTDCKNYSKCHCDILMCLHSPKILCLAKSCDIHSSKKCASKRVIRTVGWLNGCRRLEGHRPLLLLIRRC